MIPDSVANPVGYYRANVTKSLDFITHLLHNGCGRLIFSSSAAIYRAGADLWLCQPQLAPWFSAGEQ